jgi:hypothetical protein
MRRRRRLIMLGMRRRRFISPRLGGVRLLRIRVLGMRAGLGLGRVVRCGRLMLLLGGGFEEEGKRRREMIGIALVGGGGGGGLGKGDDGTA